MSRFFPLKLARIPTPVRMKEEKPAGSYRLFILGESAAVEDPEPAFGAGRDLEALLCEQFPDANFEIIDVAMTAVNSHAVVSPSPVSEPAKKATCGSFTWAGRRRLGPLERPVSSGPRRPHRHSVISLETVAGHTDNLASPTLPRVRGMKWSGAPS